MTIIKADIFQKSMEKIMLYMTHQTHNHTNHIDPSLTHHHLIIKINVVYFIS